jgi:DNA-binding response OmpR family regulator
MMTPPVLAMSAGFGVFATEATALSAGAAGFLHKPFDVGELDRVVSLTLGERV